MIQLGDKLCWADSSKEICEQIYKRNQIFYCDYYNPSRLAFGGRKSTAASGLFSECQIRELLGLFLPEAMLKTGLIIKINEDGKVISPQIDLMVLRKPVGQSSVGQFILAEQEDILLAIEIKNTANSGKLGVIEDIDKAAKFKNHFKIDTWIIWIDYMTSFSWEEAFNYCGQVGINGAVVAGRDNGQIVYDPQDKIKDLISAIRL